MKVYVAEVYFIEYLDYMVKGVFGSIEKANEYILSLDPEFYDIENGYITECILNNEKDDEK